MATSLQPDGRVFQSEQADHAAILQLAHGQAPQDSRVLEELSVGLDSLTDFWRTKYLEEYIPAGGSKIKFITGQSGSGKTHLVRLLTSMAEKAGMVTVSFSAKQVWLHDFRDVYVEILSQCGLPSLLEACAHTVIEALGFDWRTIPADMVFIDYLDRQGLADSLTKREIRLQLKRMFLDNPLMDNNFALACSLLCGGLLGHPFLENQSRQLLLSFLYGQAGLKLSALRPFGLTAARITKFNARHMLRSLCEVVRMSGSKGLFVTIDDVEVLLDGSSLNPMHYTKMKRDDTYESIRQLIDDIDSLHNLMFVFSFDRILLDNDNSGIKSYQALWMRIQNEVVSQRLNRFGDMLDLDAAAKDLYTPEVIVRMSSKLANVVQGVDLGAKTIDEGQAKEIARMASLGGVPVPRLVNQATLRIAQGDTDHV